ncbi:hypothetical protein [Mordavella massiliensis]|uniref:Uncharacterized protein n=1 Tax=Mordavella massiliensis TaxID=1871024 RepID=A0A938X9U7_9CLOT|nr:hypothetical protein [Mordavella massiliensis]MBM6947568.1 hypothetical protein [Mordavella massiliensis]
MRHGLREERTPESISMEEYLTRRQKMKEGQRKRSSRNKEKSPAWMWAGLYV